MSRVGKKPISIPAEIKVEIKDSKITFKGTKLTKELDVLGRVKMELKDGSLVFSPLSEAKSDRVFWGTYRSLANNIVIGLSSGFTKVLEFNGVGYRAAVAGKSLDLALGFSHPVKYEIPEGITISVEKNTISIKGADKQQVGQVAAEIRAFRPPEPYKGKGIKYSDEVIIRKAGKTSKK